VANGGISVFPDISSSTGICGWLGGITEGADIVENNPNASGGQTLQTDAGIVLNTDAGAEITTST
jgi:hypothetical protein